MNYEKVYAAVLDVYEDCQIRSFPFSCKEVLAHYGYRLMSYHEVSEQNPELYQMCTLYSEDAFMDRTNHLVLYNSSILGQRPRFSQMHELGHIILGHEGEKEEQEKEANLFAGMILAPSMAIHYSRLRNADDLAYAFQISYDAASCALSKYYRWYNHVLAYKMSPLDKRMYRHFYNQDKKCFVWNRHECSTCHKALYNCPGQLCPSCQNPPLVNDPFILYPRFSSPDMIEAEQKIELRRQEYNWLYNI